MGLDEGSKSARIVLVGEARDHWSEVYDRQLVGPAYTDKLLPWWNEVGLKREDFYITSVLDYHPKKIDQVPENEMRAAWDALHKRLALLKDPWLIVVLGGTFRFQCDSYALYPLTGHGRISFHKRDGKHLRPGVEHWRGSILSYQDQRGRVIKLIPTLHPSVTWGVPNYERRCRMDWLRIAQDAQFRELRLPERTHLISPSFAEAREYIRWTLHEASLHRDAARTEVALDVETPKKITYETRESVSASTAMGTKCRMCGHTRRWHGDHSKQEMYDDGTPSRTIADVACLGLRGKGGCARNCTGFAPPLLKPKRVKIEEEAYLGCIGYSWDPKLSMTIPLTLNYWQEPAKLAAIKDEIRALHADERIDFTMQNGTYDAYWCATEELPISGYRWDTLDMHRVRCPGDDQHDLAYQGSLYTRQPYWKDEAKDPDSVSRYASNSEALWHYNGIDACVTRELAPLHREALCESGRLDYYVQMSQSMIAPLMELSLHGVQTDEPGRAAEYERVVREAAALGGEINDAAGVKLVAKTAVSNAALKKFLYETLRLPVQYSKNAKKVKVPSCDVISLRRLMDRFPGVEQLATVGTLVIKHRRLNTIKGFVKADPVDPDGRLRAMFVQDTLLGRLSSRVNPRGTGRNLQNIDRKLRQFFVPDSA